MKVPRRLSAAGAAVLFLASVVLMAPTAAAADNWIKTDMGLAGASTVWYGLTSIAMGDGNRDGEPEIYVTDGDDGRVYQYKLTKRGWDITDVGGSSWYAAGIAVGDGDDDGKVEVYATSYAFGTGYQLSQFVWDKANDRWVRANLGASWWWWTGITVGDGDNTGRKGVYASSSDGHIYLYKKVGNAWNSQDLGMGLRNSQMMGVALGDGDGDGDSEVYGASSDASLYKFEYDSGTGVWGKTDMGNGSNPNGMRDVVVADGDNDGKTEVYGVKGGGAVYRYSWGGSAWQAGNIGAAGANANAIAAGDGNGDGEREIYVACQNSRIYQAKYSGGSWTFTSVGSGGGSMNDVAVGSGTPDAAQMEVYGASYDSRAYQFFVDRIPPANPLVDSPTHKVGVWSNRNVVLVKWYDPVPDISGIDGYSFIWDQNAGTVPDDTKDAEEDQKNAQSDPLPDGNSHYFHIRARDNSLNWNKTATHFGPLFIDTKPPEKMGLVIAGGADYTASPVVALTINGADATSGMGSMAFSNDGVTWTDWEKWSDTRYAWSLTDAKYGGVDRDGTKTVYAKARDLAGNEIPANLIASDTIFLDRVSPNSLSLTINGGASATNSPAVSLNITAADPEPASGLNQMAFSNDGASWSDWTKFATAYAGWDLVKGAGGSDTDGNKTVYLRVSDMAGNTGGPAAATIMLDRQAPDGLSVTIAGGAAYTNSGTADLAVSAGDPAPGTSVASMAFSNDNTAYSAWEPFAVKRAAWSMISGNGGNDTDGLKTVSLKVRDGVGNVGGPASDTIFLDRAAPKPVGILINGGAKATRIQNVTLNISATDPEPASGVDTMSLSPDGSAWTAWEPFAASRNYTLSAGEGTKTVYLRVMDRAGNVAAAVSDDIVLDTTPPALSGIKVIGITGNSAVATWNSNEGADSLVEYGTTAAYGASASDATVVTFHSLPLKGLTPETAYHYRVTSTDEAGNAATSGDYTFTTLPLPDTTPPTITGVKAEGISDSMAVITWTTGEPADSLVEFGAGVSYGRTAADTTYTMKHSVTLTGLSPATVYHFRVKSKDASGNEAASEDYTFATTAAPDKTPPTLSSIRIEGITNALAIVTWETNEPSDGVVEYGATSDLGLTASQSGFFTKHEITLTGLKPATTYYFRLKSKDPSGNGAASDLKTFTTMAEADTSPPKVTNARVEGVTANSAVVTWSTDEIADGMAEYGATVKYGSTASDLNLQTTHSLLLTGLAPGTTYHLRAKSTDPSGNTGYSGDITFTTLATGGGRDETPPIIVAVEVSAGSDRAVITWATDEIADGAVLYTNGTGPQSSSSDPNFVKSHSILLSGLQPGTVYRFTVRSADPTGNAANSTEQTFTTLGTPDTKPPVISNIRVASVTNSTAVITWETDEAATSIVDYGLNSTLGSVLADRSYVKKHSMNITGLARSTKYRFRVSAVDASGNPARSEELSFTTAATGGGTGGTGKTGKGDALAGGQFPWWLLAVLVIGAVGGAAAYRFVLRRPRPAPAREDEGDMEAEGESVPAGKGVEAKEPATPAAAASPPALELVSTSLEAVPRQPVKRIRCTVCKAVIPIYELSETPVKVECPGCGKTGMFRARPEDLAKVPAGTVPAPPPPPPPPPAPPAEAAPPPQPPQAVPKTKKIKCTACSSIILLQNAGKEQQVVCPLCGKTGMYRPKGAG